MGKMDEIILVAPREYVFEDETLTFQGVLSDKQHIEKIMNQVSSSFSEMRRGDAEEDEAFKQPIPYVIIRRGDKIFGYKRLTGGGETRLHNQLSLGYGGHMNATEHTTFEETLIDNLKRELTEELYIDLDKAELDVVGLINDDENPVGKVHLGVLATLTLEDDVAVKVRETDQIEGFWMSVEELLEEETFNKLESWSQFAVKSL